MNKTKIVLSRISPELYEDCDKVFQDLGLTFSTAIRLFLVQVQKQREIPFVITVEGKKKNDSKKG